MKPLLPVLFLALLTFWSGTFAGGASFSGAVSAQAAVLAFCLLGAGRWWDPLALGRGGRWAVPGLVLVVAASWWMSPVPRAGLVALLLLPGFLLLPAAVAACWTGPRERRLGVAGLCLLLGLVGAVALVRWQVQGTPRAAMPLGHHNLLAAWLVIVWPIALQTARRRGVWRLLAGASAAVGVAALATSGSFVGSCALVVQALMGGWWWKRARVWLALAVLATWAGPVVGRVLIERPSPGQAVESRAAQPSAGLAVPIERAPDILAGRDSSLQARLGYARAGWRGLVERPVLGWGPGSVPWTIARHLRPVAGVNPPSQVVGDLHSLPVQIGYELGAGGLLLCVGLGLLFGWRRFAELRRLEPPLADDRHLLEAALVALAGGGVVLTGSAPAHVMALPAALAVVVGAALAHQPPRSKSRSAHLVFGLTYVLPVSLLLAPLGLAQYCYQQARAATDPREAINQLGSATRYDPRFPLYQARLAWLVEELEGGDEATAERARKAAEQGHSLAPLWLSAGASGLAVGQPWAEQAFERAAVLDPLSPLPPFFLLQAGPDRADVVELGARALAAEPRLAAAVFWEARPELLAAVRARLGWPASPGPSTESAASARDDQSTVFLTLGIDRAAAVSFTLFAFRRDPWPVDLVRVRLRMDRLTMTY